MGWRSWCTVCFYITLHYFTATPPAVVVVELRDLQLHTSRHITTSTIQCTLTVYIPIQHLNCHLFPSYRNAPAHVQENAWMQIQVIWRNFKKSHTLILGYMALGGARPVSSFLYWYLASFQTQSKCYLMFTFKLPATVTVLLYRQSLSKPYSSIDCINYLRLISLPFSVSALSSVLSPTFNVTANYKSSLELPWSRLKH